MKTLKLDLEYLARTYGVELTDARVLLTEDGRFLIELTGEPLNAGL